jgi:hypothetical protein
LYVIRNKPVTQKEVALAFAKGAGHPNVPVEFIPWDEKSNFFNVNVWMDPSKIEKILGWKAHHNGLSFLVVSLSSLTLLCSSRRSRSSVSFMESTQRTWEVVFLIFVF